jgi:putative glutamine amidotransferase
MRPLVGVTSYTPAGSEPPSYSLPCDYVASLEAAGAAVVLLPGGDVKSLVSRLDGLVLSGGGDIDPARYGGPPHETTYMVDGDRDAFEFAVLEETLERGMPLLAICRGMQVLNVAFGGTLVPHLPERFGDAVAHRNPPREPVPHEVVVREGSQLAEWIGAGVHEIVSWHHQAVSELGRGLTPSAHAADGVVEALDVDSGSWVAAVQWHPELNAATSPAQAKLFSRFVDVVAGA